VTSTGDRSESVIQIRDLHFSYGEHEVLSGIDLDVRPHEVLTVMGPSGCGKTTLLRLLVGLETPTRGSVRVLGHQVGTLDEDELHVFRQRLGMCFQFGALLNSLTIADNLALPLREQGDYPEDLLALAVRSKLALVGLDDAAPRFPSELSGGMRKRAGLARALMSDPELLLFDEPTLGLDPVTAAGLDRTILDLRERLGTAAVIVTHDLATAFALADQMVVLLGGKAAATGSPEEIRQSSDPRVQAFIQRRAAAPQRANSRAVLEKFFVEEETDGHPA